MIILSFSYPGSNMNWVEEGRSNSDHYRYDSGILGRGRQKGIPGKDPSEDERKAVQTCSLVYTNRILINLAFQSGTYHVPVTRLDIRYKCRKKTTVLSQQRGKVPEGKE